MLFYKYIRICEVVLNALKYRYLHYNVNISEKALKSFIVWHKEFNILLQRISNIFYFIKNIN